MVISCINCEQKYIETDEDLINHMKNTSDYLGWCTQCMTDNMKYLIDNKKIFRVKIG